MQCAWALVLRVGIANIEEIFAVTHLTFQWYMATWLFPVCVRMLSMVGQWACVAIGELYCIRCIAKRFARTLLTRAL